MRNKTLLFLLFGCLMCFAVLLCFSADPSTKQGGDSKKQQPSAKIKISKKTTVIEGPVTKEGYVNYAEALNERLSKGVTAKNNAAVAIWQAIGPHAPELSRDVAFRAEFFTRLGIDEPPTEGDYVVSRMETAQQVAAEEGAGDARAIQQQMDEQLSKVMKQPWSKEDFPEMAKWVEENEKPLDRIVKGMRREHFYCPYLAGEDDMLVAVLLPTAQSCREIARLLSTRAMYRLNAGDIDDAWEDLQTCHRLGRHVSKGWTLVELLVGIAIDSIACQGDVAIAHHASLMTGQALKFRVDLEKLPPMTPVAEIIDEGERYVFLDSVTHLARNTPGVMEMLGADADGPGATLTKMLSKTLIDWNEPMKIGNHWYDRIAEVGRKPTFEERREAYATFDEEVKKMVTGARDAKSLAASIFLGGSPRKAIGRRVGTILIALLLPAVHMATDAEIRGHELIDLTRMSFALSAYNSDNGEFPETLDKLAPKYISELPRDYFAPGAYHYERTVTGYLLYGVGLNGEDDGGKSIFEEESGGDDLVVRFAPTQ